MARPKEDEYGRKPFYIPTEEDFTSGELSCASAKRDRQEIVRNKEKRDFSTKVMSLLNEHGFMRKPNSNAELIERIDNYFTIMAERELPPTVEHLALFLGYDGRTLWQMRNGQIKGFSDDGGVGLTTAEIAKRAYERLHAYDAAMATSGHMNFLSYCFRSKNYYGMRDKVEVTLEAGDSMGLPQSAEEIAAYLPEANVVEMDGEVT